MKSGQPRGLSFPHATHSLRSPCAQAFAQPREVKKKPGPLYGMAGSSRVTWPQPVILRSSVHISVCMAVSCSSAALIFLQACMTVVWSLPPSAEPMAG